MSATTITTAFVTQFGTTVRMLAEQDTTRLRSTVPDADTVVGEAWTTERLGGIDVEEVDGRFQPINPGTIPHTRRWGYTRAFDRAVYVDTWDKVKMLADPTSRYARRLSAAMARTMDDVIIDALSGSVREGKNAETSTAFPAGQIVEWANAGRLDMSTLLRSKEKLLAAEVGVTPAPVLVLDAAAITDLLEDQKVTNADYQNVKALVAGEVNTLIGMRVIRIERTPLNNSRRTVWMYGPEALEFGTHLPVTPSIVRAHWLRLHPWQAYIYAAFGATRVEDAQVVRIQRGS